jgi:vitamin B12 transporter
MHPSFIRTALALALAGSFNVHAASEEDKAAVVVTATRQPVRASELVSDVTVIERDEIARAGQATAAEFLATQPGVQIVENGSPGATSSVLLRGANAGHTLVLIDGIRQGSATLGSASWSRLPLAQIDRIEILRGPASSLYGSDAIGGVVQIFTRRGEGAPTFNAEAGVGSYGTTSANGGVSGAAGGLHYSVAASEFRSRGFNSIENRANRAYNPDADGFTDQSLTTAVSYDLAPGHEVGLNAFSSVGRNRYDDSYPRPASADYQNKVAVQSYAGTLKDRIADGWLSTLRIGHSSDDSTSYAAGTMINIFRTDRDQWSWQHDLRLPVGNALLAVENLDEKISGTSTYTLKERSVRSWLLGWNGRIGRQRFQANLRRDDNSQFGGRNTGSLGWGFQFDERWRASASYGTAFKAPTFNDLYYPLTYGYVGNPNLRPETSHSRELALHYERPGHHGSVVWYSNRVSNLISWTGHTSPVNIGTAELEGVTVAHTGRIGAFDDSVSLDWLDARDATTGKRLGRRARNTANAGIGQTLGAWQWRSEVQAVGQRFDDDANTKPLGGFTLLNLQGSYAVARDWSLFARLNNVFGKRYEWVADFATPGTNLFVGLRYAAQ